MCLKRKKVIGLLYLFIGRLFMVFFVRPKIQQEKLMFREYPYVGGVTMVIAQFKITAFWLGAAAISSGNLNYSHPKQSLQWHAPL